MPTNRHPTLRPADPRPWSRNRLLVMLAGITVTLGLLITGLGMAVWSAITIPDAAATPAPAASGEVVVVSVRDRFAAAPMTAVDEEAAFTPDPTTVLAPQIVVPVGTVEAGPARVPSGFPRTPEGAVGQLAAIEKTVLESMSLPVARDVHRVWVAPGGPAVEEWELTRNVVSFLAAGRQGGQQKDLTTLVTLTPAAGLVKGRDGPGWTVVCVLMDVQVAIRTEARMGYGFCSRMQWHPVEQRWLIAAGTPPAPAPSTWPGSVAAVEAGWLAWTEGVEE